PDDPPGVRSGSRGFLTGPNAEFSFEEPIANSSMLSLPIEMPPAARSFAAQVASYGATKSFRIFDPAVMRTPLTKIRSLSATGSPPKSPGARLPASISSASRNAVSGVSVTNMFSPACFSARSSAALTFATALMRGLHQNPVPLRYLTGGGSFDHLGH